MLQLRTGNRLQRRRAKKHTPRLTANQVINQEALLAALKVAQAGDVIELASGDYGLLALDGNAVPTYKFTDYVTIKSADGNGGAVFSQISVYNSSYLRFDNVTVQKPSIPGDDYNTKAVEFYKSNNMQFINSEVSGTDDNDYTNDTFGMRSARGDNIVIQNNVFHDLDRATLCFDGSNITVKNNRYYDIRSDGMNFAGVHGVLIEDNTLINWHPDYWNAHPDFIQLWTNATSGGSSNVTIRGNLGIDGPGFSTDIVEHRSSPQGVFIRDVADYGLHDFTIENNFFFTKAGWGIQLDAGTGAPTNIVVRNNTVLKNIYDIPGKPVSTKHPEIALRKGIVSGVVENNVTTFRVSADNEALLGDNNVVTQGDSVNGENYWGAVFLDPFNLPMPVNAPEDARAFLPVPGSVIEGLGAYALLESFGVPPAYIAAGRASDTSAPASSLTVTFSAEDYVADSIPAGQNVAFEWDFGDGSPTASTQTVEHVFPDSGEYTVTLTITDPDTSFDFTTERVVKVVGPFLLNLTFENTLDSLGEAGGTGTWDGTPSYAAGDDGYAASFTGVGGPRATISTDAGLFTGLPAVTIYFEFKLNGTSTARPIWTYKSAFGANIGPTGANFYITTTGTPGTWVLSPTLALGDTWHTFLATYDANTGTVNTYLDGTLIKTQSGFVGPLAEWAGTLYVGGFSNSSFDGLVDNLRVINGIVPPDEMEAFMAQYGGA
jgi:PKD repeat protein